MARTPGTDLDKERKEFCFQMLKTEDESDIIKGLIRVYHMSEPAAKKMLRSCMKSKGMKPTLESKFEQYLGRPIHEIKKV